MNLKELSIRLGLSQTTVSRALNGYPEVSDATRERVQKLAKELNYRPNTRAASLATGKAKAIGHIIPVHSSSEIINPIFAEFIAGASQTYAERGYDLVLTMANSENEQANYQDIASNGAVDGVIVHAPRLNDPRITLLNKLKMPFVTHGRDSHSDVPYSWIDINNREAFYQATCLLIDLGHRRIALINGPETLNFAWCRRQGFVEALAESGITADPALMFAGDLIEANGYHAAVKALSYQNPPTAFLVSSYFGAQGVRRAVQAGSLTVGKDVSVIIHDDELFYCHNDGDVPQFTATRSSVREAGTLAARMLLDMIDDPSRSPMTLQLNARLTIGESTGPAPVD